MTALSAAGLGADPVAPSAVEFSAEARERGRGHGNGREPDSKRSNDGAGTAANARAGRAANTPGVSGAIRQTNEARVQPFARADGSSRPLPLTPALDSHLDTAAPTADAQRLAALKAAIAIRVSIADIKRGLAHGVRGSVLFTDPPAESARAKSRELLLAIPGVGPAKADRILRRCNVQPNTRMEALTDRQRAALAEELAVHETKSRLLAAVCTVSALSDGEVEEHVENAARVAVEARRNAR